MTRESGSLVEPEVQAQRQGLPTPLQMSRSRKSLFSLRARLAALLFIGLANLSGCGGGGGSDDRAVPVEAPTGLTYAMTSAVYEVGQPIVPNRPNASGGPVERYTVEPQLPSGLSIDSNQGDISGTPADVTAPSVYVVTARNAGGTATARVQIEVRRTPAAPSGLTYRDLAATYTVGQAIPVNSPTSNGGPITAYGVSPPLPSGLTLDAHTGVITGSPSAVSVDTPYTVTASNASGTVTVILRIAVRAMEVAPTSVTYASSAVQYVKASPIVPNTPSVTGGTPTSFSVAPTLPAGLTLNTLTGAITGTPSAVQSQATYTITASNGAGSAQGQVQISVTSLGTWSAEAVIPGARHYFPMVRLANGNVLAVGGFAVGGETSSVVTYSPATQAWVTSAPLATARINATATVLADGRVLVVGGNIASGGSLASAEIYDPATDAWQSAGNMSENRTGHTATRLPSGNVLVIGGSAGAGQDSNTAELYNPTTNTWSMMVTPLMTPRLQHGAQLLPGGTEVLVFGGVHFGVGGLTSSERFPINDSGSTIPVAGAIPAGNIYTSVLLSDQSVLGVPDTGTTAVRYDPATATWSTSAYSTSRSNSTLTTLADGRALLAGGANGSARLTTAEIYDPATNLWTAASSMTTGRAASSAVLQLDGTVLMVGGFAGGELNSVERFTP